MPTVDLDVINARDAIESLKKLGIKSKAGPRAGAQTLLVTFSGADQKKKLSKWMKDNDYDEDVYPEVFEGLTLLENLLEVQQEKNDVAKQGFMKLAQQYWGGNFKTDEKLLNKIFLSKNTSDLLDFLSARSRGGFNREKFYDKYGTHISYDDVIKKLSSESSWKQLTGTRGFKGY